MTVVPGSSFQFGRPNSLLQGVDEASSASFSAVFRPSIGFPSGLGSSAFRGQVSGPRLVVSGPSSGRVTLCSSSSQSSVDYGLELQAVFLALQEFESVVSGLSVLAQSDNRSVVAYIVHQGGTLSLSLYLLALRVSQWCIRRGFTFLLPIFRGMSF